MGNIDIYATKGFEYLLILGFLAIFTAFYLFFTSRAFEGKVATTLSKAVDTVVGWFRVPDGIFYHQGHTWVRADGDSLTSTARVGMDDFAQKMVGKVGLVNVPSIGDKIRQGEKIWSLSADNKSVDMLSPVSGEVVGVNPAFMTNLKNLTVSSEALNDPFGEGWILQIKPENFNRESKHLLSGPLAKTWMEGVVENLRMKMSPEMGAVYQDGGVPISGMARSIDRKGWDKLAREFFLT